METAIEGKISTAILELPAILRPAVERWFERLGEIHSDDYPPSELTGSLIRVVACSEFAANSALKEWPWLLANHDKFLNAPDQTALREFADDLAACDLPIEEVKQQFRVCRNRQMLHILWREVEQQAEPGETLESLSALADYLTEAAAVYAQRQLQTRCGQVHDENGEPVSIVVLAMGKLGGRELNFSSDIDLIFLYPAGDDSDGALSLSAQEYFTRVSRTIVSLLDERTADGFVFRVDTRLRPFGDSGPQIVSFAALESYLLQHGRGWERYAYIKARIIGRSTPEAVAEELYGSLISPFVYRRYLDFGVFESLREMQSLIAAEVQRREMANNVKLGPGGIREIEFIVQSLQLVRGGSNPQVQGRQLQVVMPVLVGRGGLRPGAATELLDAYAFLRRLENFIQGLRDQQTHDLPDSELDRARLCLAMCYADWTALLVDLDLHRGNVARWFDEIAFRSQGDDAQTDLRDSFTALWDGDTSVENWTEFLQREEFPAATELAEPLARFASFPSTRKIDSAARQRLRIFMPVFLQLIKNSDAPLLGLTRTLAVVEKVLRRSAYLALLNENHKALARLVSLCQRSAYIAEQISRYPVLLDELLDPRIYNENITREDFQREFEYELEQRLAPADDADSEARMEMLGQFQRASMFRIAVADFNGDLPIMKVSDGLTKLAEAVLGYALQVAWQELTSRHGSPKYSVDGETRTAGFGIVGYGKLGGIELSYRSDLDLVFLHDSTGKDQLTDGDMPVENTVFFARLVRRLVFFLTTQTGSGFLYEIDTRLRPDGHSGLLVTSTDAFERYQEENAWTWEQQALLRARPVAGSAAVGKQFNRIRSETLMRRVRRATLQADVASMRQRMRKELDKSDAAKFDLKQGRGGIGDIEFLVQYLVLKYADEYAEVIQFTDNIRQLDALAETACISAQDAAALQEVYRQYRRRLHRLTLNDSEPLVGVDDFADERTIVSEIWHRKLESDEHS